MKKKSEMKAIILSSLIIFLLASCQKKTDLISSNRTTPSVASESKMSINNKEAVTRAYRDSFEIDLVFVPDIPGGWTPADVDAPAWFHGTGEGNATHMGNVHIYFNSHTLRNSAGTVVVYHGPVNQFYEAQLLQFNVPTDVTAVIFDDKGNSIWLRTTTEGWPSWHIDATHIAMGGKMLIVGGTGKFVGATGEIQIHAAFNQLNLEDATLSHQGWIRY